MNFRSCIALAGLLSFFTPLHANADQFRVLYTFKGYGTGGVPEGGVILGSQNTLYGETAAGGTAPCSESHGDPHNGCGTVYSVSKAGGFKVLASFHGPNGAYGTSGLTLVGNTLYGATERGGAFEKGVIFSVNTDGSNFTLLHQFNGIDGDDPIGPLVPGPNGILYGFTTNGGPNYPSQSPGVLFSLSPSGAYTILHVFSPADGYFPNTLVMTPSGTLVGGTSLGGPGNNICGTQGCGVIFSFNPTLSQYTLLKTYDGSGGTTPFIGSVAADGTIYGNDFNLFSITLAGNYQILASSDPCFIGQQQQSGPTLGPGGILYGTFTTGQCFNTSGSLYSYNPANPGVLTLDYSFGSQGSGSPPAAQPIVLPNGDVIGTAELTKNDNGGTIWEYTP